MKDYFKSAHNAMKEADRCVERQGCPDDLPPPSVIKEGGVADCLYLSILYLHSVIKENPELEQTAKIYQDYEYTANLGHAVCAWPVERRRAFSWLPWVKNKTEEVMLVLDPMFRKPQYKELAWLQRQEREISYRTLCNIWKRNYGVTE